MLWAGGPTFTTIYKRGYLRTLVKTTKKTLALLELYGDVIASCSNGRQRKCNFSLPAGKADVNTS